MKHAWRGIGGWRIINSIPRAPAKASSLCWFCSGKPSLSLKSNEPNAAISNKLPSRVVVVGSSPVAAFNNSSTASLLLSVAQAMRIFCLLDVSQSTRQTSLTGLLGKVLASCRYGMLTAKHKRKAGISSLACNPNSHSSFSLHSPQGLHFCLQFSFGARKFWSGPNVFDDQGCIKISKAWKQQSLEIWSQISWPAFVLFEALYMQAIGISFLWTYICSFSSYCKGRKTWGRTSMHSLAACRACRNHIESALIFPTACSLLVVAMPIVEVARTIAAGYMSPSDPSAPRKRCCSWKASKPACKKHMKQARLCY